jgi:hypothetical protein
MTPSDELDLIKQRVRRIEADLAHARQQLDDFERRLTSAIPATNPARVQPVAIPATVATVEPPPLPPPFPVLFLRLCRLRRAAGEGH